MTLALDATATSPGHLRLATESGALLADVGVRSDEPLKLVTAVVHAGGELRLAATLTSEKVGTVVVTDLGMTKER